MADSPYNELLLDCFNSPRHAGGGGRAQFSGLARESATGPRVRIACGIDNGKLQNLRFRAWGCPHFLAAAELLCRQLEGLPVTAIDGVDVMKLGKQLAVPVEKTGRILTLEDAWGELKRVIRINNSLQK